MNLNLAIGPSCFVRCLGCYNHFGNSSKKGGLVSGDDVVSFVREALPLGVRQVTISGGDPLTHPDLLSVLRNMHALNVPVKLDTVGTAFLSSARKVFYGSGQTDQVSLRSIVRYVDTLGIPIDGSTEDIRSTFRTGRPELLAEAVRTVKQAVDMGCHTCVNTVITKRNAHDLDAMFRLVNSTGCQEWQIFEFQPSGPLGARTADLFVMRAGAFDKAISELASNRDTKSVRIIAKNRLQRSGMYFMVDDRGIAWLPDPNGTTRQVIGHVTRDRGKVLSCLSERAIQRAAAA